MSEKTPKIHKAIQSIDPAQADKVTAKYEHVMAGIDSALMAKNPVAQSAKTQVDFLVQDLIREGAKKDLDTAYKKKKQELLDDFNQELDVISVSLGLDTEKSDDKKPEASSLKKERAPGFAESFKPTDLQEILHHYSAQQKLDMLHQVQEEFELPPERESRLEQLTILITALDSVRTNLLERRTLDEQLYYGASLTIGRVAQYNEAKKIESLIENLQKEGIPAILANDLTVEEFLSKHPFGKEVKSALQEYSATKAFFDKHGKLKDVIDEKDRMEYYSALVDFLADQRDYQGIRAVIEEQMKEEFAMAESKMLKDIEIEINGEKKRVNSKLHDKAKDKIEDLVNASVRKEWRKEGMTEEQMDETQNELIELQYKRLQNEYIAEHILIGKDDDAEEGLMQIGVSKRNQALWEKYKEVFDSKNETFNLASTTWDLILDEIIVNAPLIVASGVVAGVVTKALSLGARAVIAGTRLGTIGARLATGGRLARTAYKVGKLGSKATVMITEGFMFELVYNGIQADLLFNQEDWVKRVLWTSATLGLFKAAGKFGKARSVEFNIWFQKVAPKIGDKKVVELINQIVIQGHVEVAAMLAIGGAQHLTEGQIDEFFDHFGYQLFHAYVSIGALHVAGKVIVTGGGKILAPRSKPKSAAEKPSEKGSERPTAETSKKAGEAAPEKPNFYEKLNSAAESSGSKEVEVSTSRELNDGLDTLRDRGFQFRLNENGTVTAFKGDVEVHLKETGKLAELSAKLLKTIDNLRSAINDPSLTFRERYLRTKAEMRKITAILRQAGFAVRNAMLGAMVILTQSGYIGQKFVEGFTGTVLAVFLTITGLACLISAGASAWWINDVLNRRNTNKAITKANSLRDQLDVDPASITKTLIDQLSESINKLPEENNIIEPIRRRLIKLSTLMKKFLRIQKDIQDLQTAGKKTGLKDLQKELSELKRDIENIVDDLVKINVWSIEKVLKITGASLLAIITFIIFLTALPTNKDKDDDDNPFIEDPSGSNPEGSGGGSGIVPLPSSGGGVPAPPSFTPPPQSPPSQISPIQPSPSGGPRVIGH